MANKVGYFSAYYRGLEALLKMWPEIRKQVPDASLDIYYGWQSWDAMSGDHEFKPRILKLLAELKDQGVTEHGRVDHETLAQAMLDTDVWAYPTEFPEIHCITALKAQQAGCYPVTTNVAALKETVQCGDVIDCANIYSNDYAQKKFIRAVVSALKENKVGTPVKNAGWDYVAKQWEAVL